MATFTATAFPPTATQPLTFTWDFGDGSAGMGQVVNHAYAADGDYLVTLTATNKCGQAAVTHTIFVCEPVHDVDFTWDPLMPEVNQVVTFTGSASGTNPVFEWWFGDGISDTGQVVTHAYADPGDYDLILYVWNDCSEAVMLSDTLTVITPCQGVDILTVTTVISGCMVDFAAELNGDPPFVYAWDFGFFGSSSEPTPTVDFVASGTYPYTLTVTNCQGAASDTHVDEVTVECAGCLPPYDAAFDWSPITPTVGEMVFFHGSAHGSEPLAYAWDFGDGNTGSGADPIHAYGAAGDYGVVMTVTGQCGDPDIVSHMLTVITGCSEPSNLDFDWSPTPPIVGEPVTFSGVSGGTPPLTFTWAFGDGAGGEGNPVTHTYALSNSYTITMTVTNACGTGTVSYVVPIVSPPEERWTVYLPLVFKSTSGR